MKNANKVRFKANLLEEKIEKELSRFLFEVGDCDVSIDVNIQFEEFPDGKRTIVNKSVKVNVKL